MLHCKLGVVHCFFKVKNGMKLIQATIKYKHNTKQNDYERSEKTLHKSIMIKYKGNILVFNL